MYEYVVPCMYVCFANIVLNNLKFTPHTYSQIKRAISKQANAVRLIYITE